MAKDSMGGFYPNGVDRGDSDKSPALPDAYPGVDPEGMGAITGRTLIMTSRWNPVPPEAEPGVMSMHETMRGPEVSEVSRRVTAVMAADVPSRPVPPARVSELFSAEITPLMSDWFAKYPDLLPQKEFEVDMPTPGFAPRGLFAARMVDRAYRNGPGGYPIPRGRYSHLIESLGIGAIAAGTLITSLWTMYHSLGNRAREALKEKAAIAASEKSEPVKDLLPPNLSSPKVIQEETHTAIAEKIRPADSIFVLPTEAFDFLKGMEGVEFVGPVLPDSPLADATLSDSVLPDQAADQEEVVPVIPESDQFILLVQKEAAPAVDQPEAPATQEEVSAFTSETLATLKSILRNVNWKNGIHHDLVAATAIIDTKKGRFTGVVLTPSMMVTDAEVAREMENLRAVKFGEAFRMTSVKDLQKKGMRITYDDAQQLAFVHFASPVFEKNAPSVQGGFYTLPSAADVAPTVGQPLLVCGNPSGKEPRYRDGGVITEVRADGTFVVGIEGAAGYAGSPVTTPDGQIVGIVVGVTEQDQALRTPHTSHKDMQAKALIVRPLTLPPAEREASL